jgi:hypothetical protein
MQELLVYNSAVSMITKLTLSAETVDVYHNGFELLLRPDPSDFITWLSNDETRRTVEFVIQENATRVFQQQQVDSRKHADSEQKTVLALRQTSVAKHQTRLAKQVGRKAEQESQLRKHVQRMREEEDARTCALQQHEMQCRISDITRSCLQQDVVGMIPARDGLAGSNERSWQLEELEGPARMRCRLRWEPSFERASYAAAHGCSSALGTAAAQPTVAADGPQLHEAACDVWTGVGALRAVDGAMPSSPSSPRGHSARCMQDSVMAVSEAISSAIAHEVATASQSPVREAAISFLAGKVAQALLIHTSTDWTASAAKAAHSLAPEQPDCTDLMFQAVTPTPEHRSPCDVFSYESRPMLDCRDVTVTADSSANNDLRAAGGGCDPFATMPSEVPDALPPVELVVSTLCVPASQPGPASPVLDVDLGAFPVACDLQSAQAANLPALPARDDDLGPSALGSDTSGIGSRTAQDEQPPAQSTIGTDFACVASAPCSSAVSAAVEGSSAASSTPRSGPESPLPRADASLAECALEEDEDEDDGIGHELDFAQMTRLRSLLQPGDNIKTLYRAAKLSGSKYTAAPPCG